ncbi:MAG: hypothetical protein P8Y04_07970 [Desulfobulbaceae bacterium]
MQSFDRLIDCLFADGIIKPGGWIIGVKFLGNCILPSIKLGALFFIIGFAKITADQTTV